MDFSNKKCKVSNIATIWLDKFKENNLTILDIRNYWKTKVPVLLDIDLNKTSLDISYDEEKIYEELIFPLNKFICDSEDIENVLNELKKNDGQPKLCGKIFKSNEPIYFCKDCGVDSTCVRCVDCFKNSSHRNHKYRINMSSGGGFCDCGDVEAWKSYPFCDIHVKRETTDEKNFSYNKYLTEDIIERFRLITVAVVNYCVELLSWEKNLNLPDDLDDNSITVNDKFAVIIYNDEIHNFDQVIRTLLRTIVYDYKICSDFATFIDRTGRSIVKVDTFEVCIDKKHLIKRITTRSDGKALKAKVKRVSIIAHQEFALKLLKWLCKILSYCEGFCYIFGTVMQGKKKIISSNQIVEEEVTLLETVLMNDVILWKVAKTHWYELLIYGMLMNSITKKFYAKTYTRLYRQITQEFIKDSHDHCFSIGHLSIQVYSVPTLAHLIIEDDDAFYIIAKTFIDQCQQHVENNKFCFKRDPNSIISFKRSQNNLMDLKYLLGTKPSTWTDKLRKSFLHGFEEILRLFMYMQDMDTIVRQICQHIEFEPDWEIGMNLQLQMSHVITTLLEWCSSDQIVLIKALSLAFKALESKMSEVIYVETEIKGYAKCQCIDYDVSTLPVTIHLALTRIVAGLFLELTKFNIDFKDIDSPLKPVKLMELPLRTLVMISQFRAGMWRRNGYSLINQVYFYHSENLRDEMYDRDILMLQYVGCLMPPNEFLIHLLNKFKLVIWLTEKYDALYEKPQEDFMRHTITLVQEFLNLLLIIVSERYLPGVGQVDTKDKVKKEIIQLLCIEPLTHSDLIKNFPKIPVDISVEEIIKEVANFKKNTNSQSGKYELKEEYYKDFNPFFYHYSRQDQCSAEEMQIKRKKNNKEQLLCCPPPVPPQFTPAFLPLRNILQCDILLYLIKVLLKRISSNISALFSETQYEKTLHLIGIALHEEEYEILNKKKNNENSEISFDFTTKFEKFDLLNLLEICKNSPNVSLNKDLSTWVITKYKKVRSLRNGIDNSKILTTNKPHLSAVETSTKENDSKKNSVLAAELRKKIMAQMSAMQNKFIQINSEFFNENQDDENSVETEVQKTSDNLTLINSDPIAIGNFQRGKFSNPEIYFCMLCREREDRLNVKKCMVLAAFVQNSTVLSKNRNRDIYIKPEMNSENLPLALSADLYCGIHVSTCGHIMHSECWKNFHSSVLAKERHRPIRFAHPPKFDIDDDEYLCPLCECLCNAVMPIVSNNFYRNNLRNTKSHQTKISINDWLNFTCNLVSQVKPYTEKKIKLYKPNSFEEATSNLSEESKESFNIYRNVYSQNALKESLFNKTLIGTIKSLSKTINKIESSSLISESSDDFYSLNAFWACAFTIQALEKLLRKENIKLNDLPSRKYICLQVLVRYCTVNSVIYNPKFILSYCTQLMRYLFVNECYNLNSYSILDLDAFSILVSLILTNPSLYINNQNGKKQKNNLYMPLANTLDQYLVQLIFLFHIVQIILTQNDIYDEALMDTEENAKEMSNQETRCIASFYVDILKAAGIKSSFVDLVKMDNCVAERIAKTLRSSLLPFLRCCTLFFHFLTEIVTPKTINENSFTNNESSEDAEFIILCDYLALPKKLSEIFSNKTLTSLAQSWARHPRVNLIIQENRKLKNLEENQTPLLLPLKLIKQPHTINRLIDLPDDYSDLINNVPFFPCYKSDLNDSTSPTICLVCGAKLCSQSYCCQRDLNNTTVGACCYHAHKCGAGFGVFLRIKDCNILLLAPKFKGCYIDAPYVDEYGETDRNLRRGNPLHLNKESYNELNKLWLKHGIPEKVARAIEQSSNFINTWQTH